MIFTSPSSSLNPIPLLLLSSEANCQLASPSFQHPTSRRPHSSSLLNTCLSLGEIFWVSHITFPQPQLKQAFPGNSQAPLAREIGNLIANLPISLISSKSNLLLTPQFCSRPLMWLPPPPLSLHLQWIADLLFQTSSPLTLLSQHPTSADKPWGPTSWVCRKSPEASKVGRWIPYLHSSFSPQYPTPRSPLDLWETTCCDLSLLPGPIPRGLSRSWWNTLFSPYLRKPSPLPKPILIPHCQPPIPRNTFDPKHPITSPSRIPKELPNKFCVYKATTPS